MNTVKIKLYGLIYLAIEVALFIVIGVLIGFGWAILIFLAPVFIGMYMLRKHAQALMQAQRSSNLGMNAMLPALTMLGKMGQIIVGMLLVIPGLITTLLGLLMMIKPIRKRTLNFVMRKALSKAFVKGAHPSFAKPAANEAPKNDESTETNTKDKPSDKVIEGEFKKE